MDMEYCHVFPTWEVYPRVHYFKARYLDLRLRFYKVMKALPERFHNKRLMSRIEDLSRYLGNFLRVTVIGSADLVPGKFVASMEALTNHTDVPGQGPGDIHICLCHAKVRDLGEVGLQDIGVALQYLSPDFLQRCSCLSTIFIVCETEIKFHDSDVEQFRSHVLEKVQKLTEDNSCSFEILIGPEEATRLPSSVSNAIEKQLIDGFSEIFMFLQTFIRKDFRCDQENIIILESETVVKAIQSFLRDSHNLIDSKAVSEHTSFFDLVLQTLCHQVTCAAVSPLAAKHNIPDWVCYGLLQEINFEEDLQKSFSPSTIHHLEKVEECAQKQIQLKAERKAEETTSQPKCLGFDFILYMLQKDMTKAVEPTEKKLSAMNRLTTVMRKMMFEIGGYLKQAIFPVEITESGQREITLEDITEKLREDIMRTSGVYGMGTLYGQLEVHLKKELEEDEIKGAKTDVAEVMKNHRFSLPYIIKIVDTNPKQFARSFYEPGHKIFSPFPNDETLIREGTLGCFIKGSDGVVYAVTCAHVVDPHEKNEHQVYITTQPERFAISRPRMLFYGGDVDLHLADFAAIQVLPENLQMCSFHLKDEFGNSKKASLTSEVSSKLVGDFVFKYGASTDLTKGIIASSSYLFSGQTSYEHLVIVEPLPVPSDDICRILNSESYDSRPSSQVTEGAPMDTEESDLTDLLRLDSSQNGVASNKSLSKHEEAGTQDENGFETNGKLRAQEKADILEDIGIEPNKTSSKQERDGFPNEEEIEMEECPICSNEGDPIDTEEPDIPDLLQIDSSENGIEFNKTANEQREANISFENGTDSSRTSSNQEGADLPDANGIESHKTIGKQKRANLPDANGIESNRTVGKQANLPDANGIELNRTVGNQEGPNLLDANGIESNRTIGKQEQADLPDANSIGSNRTIGNQEGANLSGANGIESNRTIGKQEETDLPDANSIGSNRTIGKLGKHEESDASDQMEAEIEQFSNVQNIRPRPETGDICCGRNSETGFLRNANEILSGTLSNISVSDTPKFFADQGDSGSIVCKRDLLKDEIVVISMVTAGNFKLNNTLNSESDSDKCLSVRMDRMLAKLQERSGHVFMLCRP